MPNVRQMPCTEFALSAAPAPAPGPGTRRPAERPRPNRRAHPAESPAEPRPRPVLITTARRTKDSSYAGCAEHQSPVALN
jgi:hypothetical protein